MDPEVEQNVFFPLLEAGAATLIDVEPLEPDALKALLHSLEDPLLDRLSPALERYSGGNPMFVLELLKSLYETGQIQRGLPQQLGVPGKIGFVVQRRLERSPGGFAPGPYRRGSRGGLQLRVSWSGAGGEPLGFGRAVG